MLITACVMIATVNSIQHYFSYSFLRADGKQYQVNSLIWGYDETNVIAPRIKEVLEGRLIASDIDLWEYKSAPAFWPPASPLFFAPFRLFTTSVQTVFIITDALVPMIIFLLLFGIYFFLFDKRKYVSLWCALFTSLYVTASLHLPPTSIEEIKVLIKQLLPLNVGTHLEATFLTRRESFIPTILPFLASFLFAYLTAIKQKRWCALLGGAFLALNAFSYPYHFIYATIGIGLFFVLSSRPRDLAQIRRYGWFILAAALCLIPFAWWQISLRALPQYQDVFSRFGTELGHAFRFDVWKEYVIYLALIGCVWKVDTDRLRKRFVIALLITNIIVLNLQVILGFSVQTDHWFSREIFLSLFLAYAVVLVRGYDALQTRLPRIRKAVTVCAWLLILSLVIHGIQYSYLRSKTYYTYQTIPAALMEAFTWLSEHTPSDSVVVSPSLVTNSFIPVYTHNNIYIPRGLNTLAPDAEIFDRLFAVYAFFGMSEDRIRLILDPSLNNEYVTWSEFEHGWEKYEKSGILYLLSVKYGSKEIGAYQYGRHNKFTLPDDVYQTLLATYRAYECSDCLNKYRADYLFYGPFERAIIDTNLSAYPDLTKVYDQGGVQIFQFTSPQQP